MRCASCINANDGEKSAMLECKHYICNQCYYKPNKPNKRKTTPLYKCTYCKKERKVTRPPKYLLCLCNYCGNGIDIHYICQNRHIICFKCRTLSHDIWRKTDYCPICQDITKYSHPTTKQVHTYCKCSKYAKGKRTDTCSECNIEIYGLILHLQTLNKLGIINYSKLTCTYCNIYSQNSVLIPYRCQHFGFCNKCALLLRTKPLPICCPIQNCSAKRCNAFTYLEGESI